MSGAARAIVLDLEALGINPDPYLAEVGLSRKEVFDPDQRLAPRLTEALWAAAAEHMGDPLRAAARLPLGAYRVIDFVAAKSETVGAGLRRIASYFPLVDPRVRLVVEEDVVDSTLSMLTADGSPVPPVAQLFTFAAIVLRSRRFTGLDWPLARVDFTFDAPDDAPEIERTFGSACAFGQQTPRLVLTRETFSLPLPSAEREILPLLDQHAQEELERLDLDLEREPVPGFHEALRAACAEGRPTLSIVARRLAVSPRSLQRRLDEQGVSFSTQLDAFRQAQAEAYLRARGLSIAEVAFVLGFSDQPAFTRAFSRWTGVTPHAFRAKGRGA
jgi:AraC-like DNA-binding protein